jgi:acyl-CoA dehydrogenase
MDVHGGKGICMGPSNYLGRTYQQIPVSITVEGANILTRSLIIFGQGAIRCHPYILKEIDAAKNTDDNRALEEFDRALKGHLAFSFNNGFRCLLYGLSGGSLAKSPNISFSEEIAGYYRQLTRFSTAFALAADVSMLILGGSLKRKEKLSARLGDILSMLYLCSATLKRFEDDGRPDSDLPLLHWSIQDALYRMQLAFYGLLDNFPNRIMSWKLRLLIFPLGRAFSPPSDELGHKVVKILMTPGDARDRLTTNIYIPTSDNEPLGVLEQALQCAEKCKEANSKIRTATKAGSITAKDHEKISEALEKGIITDTEAESLQEMESLRRRVIMVDDFPPDFS